MGKRKRPSRATRKKTAPSPAPRMIADGGETSPAREPPAEVSTVPAQAAQDVVKKTDDGETKVEAQSEVKREDTAVDVDAPAPKCSDERSEYAETTSHSDDKIQVGPVPDEKISAESNNSAALEPAQSQELVETEQQPSDDVAPPETALDRDERRTEKACPESASENDPERPPPQNDSVSTQERKDSSQTTDVAPKSELRKAPNKAPNIAIKPEAQEEKKSTKPPPEDAWTQTDDLSMDVPETRAASNTRTPTRTQDEAVTSSDQSASKDETEADVTQRYAHRKGRRQQTHARDTHLSETRTRTLLERAAVRLRWRRVLIVGISKAAGF